MQVRGFAVLVVLALSLAGCPAFLSDNFAVTVDAGSIDAGREEHDATVFEGGAPGQAHDGAVDADVDSAANVGDSAAADVANGSGGPASDSGGDSSVKDAGGGDAGAGRSCNGFAATCGAGRNTSCCSFSIVPGGTYNRSNDATYPATVSGFALDDYEISVGRFRQFVAAYSQNMIASGAGKDPNDASDPGWDSAWNASLPANAAALVTAVKCDTTYATWTDSAGANENLPINCIDWAEAFAFCIWDGGRLPSEAEWNYAAAGGAEQRQYPWGATVPGANAGLAVYNCYYNGTGSCSGVTNIAPVGSVTAGNAKWGQSDLAGNVWEWTLDAFASTYTQIPCDNCANTTVGASNRVLRGGSYSYDGTHLLTSDRSSGFGPTVNYPEVGARCARTP